MSLKRADSEFEEDEPLPEPDCDELDNLLNLGDHDTTESQSTSNLVSMQTDTMEDDLDLSFGSLDDLRVEEDRAHIMDGSMPPKQNMNTTSPKEQDIAEYILGTLIVRVVAAKDIKPIVKGGIGDVIFGKKDSRRGLQSGNKRRSRDELSYRRRQIIDKGSSNPFATIAFNNQSQRTSTVFDTVDPTWPREEQFYFDVSIPITKLAQEDGEDGAKKVDELLGKEDLRQIDSFLPPPDPYMTISIANANPYEMKKSKIGGKKKDNSDDQDNFLGMTRPIDTTPLITGKQEYMDEWLALEGGEDISGRLRIILEYCPSDPPPRPGDLVQFTGFVNPLDVFPVGCKVFRVDETVNENEVFLSYRTKPEGWTCTFTAHRYMLIAVCRYHTAVERYQEELMDLAEKLSHSPAIHVVADTVSRLPEDGLLTIGFEAASEGVNLLGRWFNGGLGKAIDDTVYAFNMDGQHCPTPSEVNDSDDGISERSEASIQHGENGAIDNDLSIDDEIGEDSVLSLPKISHKLEHSTSRNAANEGATANNAATAPSLCVVCLSQQKSVLLLPCNHMCVCKACSSHPSLKSCPICRVSIMGKNEVYW